MISIPTLIIRIAVEWIVGHQSPIQVVVGARIVWIRAIRQLLRIRHAVTV